MDVLIGIVISILAVYFYLQYKGSAPVGPSVPAAAGREASSAHVLNDSVRPIIPEDSTLRRHYVTHVRHMIESVKHSRPTESVLRRHYDQLIESELERCLSSEVHLQQLVLGYEANKRTA